MHGTSKVLKNYSIIFRSPELNRRQVHGEAIMYWMVNADVPALLGPMDQHGLWFFMATKLDENGESIDPVRLIRSGTGLEDLDVEVVRTDPWSALQPDRRPLPRLAGCSSPAMRAICIRRSAASA